MLLAIVGRRGGDASALGPASYQWSQQRRWGACSWFSSLAGSGETERPEREKKPGRQKEHSSGRRGLAATSSRTPPEHSHTLFSLPGCNAQRPQHATLGMRHTQTARQPPKPAHQDSTPRQHSTHTLPGLQIDSGLAALHGGYRADIEIRARWGQAGNWPCQTSAGPGLFRFNLMFFGAAPMDPGPRMAASMAASMDCAVRAAR